MGWDCCRFGLLTRSGFEALRRVVVANVPTKVVATTAFDPLTVGAEPSRRR